jgi:hypothetical protein
MKSPFNRWIPVSAALAALALALSPVPFALATQEKGDAIQLFNGKDLSNFYTWLVDQRYDDPDDVFSVVDAIDGAPAIRVSGQHYGAFITKEAYANYHLVTEFRWGLLTWANRKAATRDSGILLHCQGPDGNTKPDFNGPWMLSQECQIIEGGVGDFIMVAGHDGNGSRIIPKLTATVRKEGRANIYDPNAPAVEFTGGGRVDWYGRDPEWKDMLGFRGRQDVESPYGEWTRLEVICDGSTIVVNGKVVNKGTNSSLTRGKIIFQSEGAEIFFRKIELTPLRR